MPRILLVGCGRIAQGSHLPSLVELRREGLVDIVGVCDIDISRAQISATKFGVENYGSDWVQMVSKFDPEIISVCLPPGPNANIAIQAVEMKKHVLCEKPPARYLEQAEAMSNSSKLSPASVTSIAFNRRYAPLYKRAIERSLKFGEPNIFYGKFTRPGLGTDPSDTANDWITSDSSHVLDLAIATIGLPHLITVSRKNLGGTLDNVWIIKLQTMNGIAELLFNFAAGRRIERFEWIGSGYDVSLELPERAEWAQQGREVETWNASELTKTDASYVNYGYLDEYRTLINAIRGQEPRPKADFAYAATFMRIVQGILDCPDGESFSLELPKNNKTNSSSQQPHIKNSLVFNRPTVKIMQLPSTHARYFDIDTLTRLGELCDLQIVDNDSIKNSDVVITGWGAPAISREAIKYSERLKLVVVLGASVKSAYPDLLFERNILLCNTADAIAQSVAEHCLLLTLAGLRRLTEIDAQMHHGLWPLIATSKFALRETFRTMKNIKILRPLIPFARPIINGLLPVKLSGQNNKGGQISRWYDLNGQIVGIIGWGNIARHFVRLLKPFGCNVLVSSNSISDQELEFFQLHRASLGEIMGSSKVISLHKGMTPKTKGLIGKEALYLMRPGTILVNTARAGIIDESALLGRLSKGDIVVALDVFHREPLPKNDNLRKFPNVILTPHMSNDTPECYRRAGQQALAIVIDWLQGKSISTLNADYVANMT